MPDIIRVRNRTRDEITVAALGRTVAPDCVTDFPGRLIDEAGDRYLIESGNPPVQRAWPKATWNLESERKRAE